LAGMVVFGIVAVGTAVAAPDQFAGTWKANMAKSTYSPGPAPKSATVKIESDEKGFSVDATLTDADGKETHVKYAAKYDGKDYPATGVAYADAVSAKRVDANTVELLMKKGGKVMVTVTSTVSKDGKTRTATFKGKNENGQDVNNVVAYEKQ